MSGESEAASVWAALLGMAFFIAAMITAAYWLYIYHDEARQVQPNLGETCTTIQMIWEDVRMPMK
jgi:hypothetical protein